MTKTSVLFVSILVIAYAAGILIPARAADISQALILTAEQPANSMDLILKIETLDASGTRSPGLTRSVTGGMTALEDFDKWYEDLFALTYMSGDTGRLWKSLRSKTAGLTKTFLTPEMIDMMRGTDLLIVADNTFPFPADVFRVSDQWLFEIVPIVHTVGVPETIPDLNDDYKYKNVLVLDCQGPDDREGEEAPGVAKFLESAGIEHKFLITLNNPSVETAFEMYEADILHLATHAHPDEFFPGRGKAGITAARLKDLPTRYRTVLSTGCNTGHPAMAGAMLDDGTRFYIASMYVTSGKDGIVFGSDFYTHVFSGESPFKAFYAVKQNITGKKSDYPDILRFALYVK